MRVVSFFSHQTQSRLRRMSHHGQIVGKNGRGFILLLRDCFNIDFCFHFLLLYSFEEIENRNYNIIAKFEIECNFLSTLYI